MNRPATVTNATGLGRRSLLGIALVGCAVPLLSTRAFADVDTSGAFVIVRRFNSALIGAMMAGRQLKFQARFTQLAPAVEEAFDLPAVLAISLGPRWSGIAPDQQSRLLDAFRSYTIASYVTNFDSYEGQRFIVSSNVGSVGADQVVVSTRIVPVSGEPIQLGYVVRRTPAGCKIVDVLADGSISRVAVQRSDFRGVLASGGGEALVARLQRKTSDLSNGAIA
jgi:phospholipid transport system substrate-binding protein